MKKSMNGLLAGLALATLGLQVLPASAHRGLPALAASCAEGPAEQRELPVGMSNARSGFAELLDCA